MTSHDQAVGGEVTTHRTRRLTRALVGALLLLPLLTVFMQPAQAQDTEPAAGVAVVLQVSGLLDPLLADFVADAIHDADAEGARTSRARAGLSEPSCLCCAASGMGGEEDS